MLKAPALESHGYTLLGTGKTAADWEAFDETLCRVELVDGELWMAPRPSAGHQRAQSDITRFLVPWVTQHDMGRILFPPVGLMTPMGDIFEPDLVFFEKSHPQYQQDWTELTHPPALVIEIVSPSSRKRDWMVKRDAYAAMGVPNYWIVETQDSAIWGFALVNGAYVEVEQKATGFFEAAPFEGLQIPLAEVFA